VRFAPDGRTLAVGDAAGVRLWNATRPEAPASLGQPLTGSGSKVTSVAFSPGGQTIAAGSADDTVHRWNMARPQRPYPLGLPLAGPSNSVMSMAFGPDGRRLAAGNADGAVNLWSLPATVLTGAGCPANVRAADARKVFPVPPRPVSRVEPAVPSSSWPSEQRCCAGRLSLPVFDDPGAKADRRRGVLGTPPEAQITKVSSIHHLLSVARPVRR
jgi:WD40 repeat protein